MLFPTSYRIRNFHKASLSIFEFIPVYSLHLDYKATIYAVYLHEYISPVEIAIPYLYETLETEVLQASLENYNVSTCTKLQFSDFGPKSNGPTLQALWIVLFLYCAPIQILKFTYL